MANSGRENTLPAAKTHKTSTGYNIFQTTGDRSLEGKDNLCLQKINPEDPVQLYQKLFPEFYTKLHLRTQEQKRFRHHNSSILIEAWRPKMKQSLNCLLISPPATLMQTDNGIQDLKLLASSVALYAGTKFSIRLSPGALKSVSVLPANTNKILSQHDAVWKPNQICGSLKSANRAPYL